MQTDNAEKKEDDHVTDHVTNTNLRAKRVTTEETNNQYSCCVSQVRRQDGCEKHKSAKADVFLKSSAKTDVFLKCGAKTDKDRDQ